MWDSSATCCKCLRRATESCLPSSGSSPIPASSDWTDQLRGDVYLSIAATPLFINGCRSRQWSASESFIVSRSQNAYRTLIRASSANITTDGVLQDTVRYKVSGLSSVLQLAAARQLPSTVMGINTEKPRTSVTHTENRPCLITGPSTVTFCACAASTSSGFPSCSAVDN